MRDNRHTSRVSEPSDNQPGESQSQAQGIGAITRVDRQSTVRGVQEQLVKLIESGQLEVGQWLPSEAELARAFGVSRPALREALGSVRALGYIESQVGRGSIVVADHVSSAQLFLNYSAADLNEVRRCLELPAARHAATRRSEKEMAVIKQATEAYAAQADARERVVLDGELHVAIARASGNPLLARLVEDIRSILEVQSLALSGMSGRWECSAEEHAAISAAIESQDADAAGAAMLQHLDAVEQAILRIPKVVTD